MPNWEAFPVLAKAKKYPKGDLEVSAENCIRTVL